MLMLTCARAYVLAGVRSRQVQAAGECSDESAAATRLMGARRRGPGVVLAGSSCDGRVLPESVSNDDLSQRYGQPYAERGHVCVSCVALCVVVRVAAGQLVARIICGDSGDGGMLGSEISGDFGVAQ